MSTGGDYYTWSRINRVVGMRRGHPKRLSGNCSCEWKPEEMKKDEIKIEGMSQDEILALPEEHLDSLVFTGNPIVLRAGSAEVLGSFSCGDRALRVELAQIDGGGEGVLILLTVLAKQIARRRHCESLEWIVHAVHCADPNLKLRRVLERRGFKVAPYGASSAYLLTEAVR